VFLGEYRHNLDLKGRMAMPAKFRNGLKKGSIITRGIDQCLFVFDRNEWEKLAKKIIELPLTQANSRAFSRLMMAGAADAPIDKQGRVLIPDYLKEYARLGKEAVVIGLYNRVEIWDKKIWEKYKNRTEKQSEKIAEQLHELGI